MCLGKECTVGNGGGGVEPLVDYNLGCAFTRCLLQSSDSGF